MAFYMLCAAGDDKKAKPCALIEAVSDTAAEREAIDLSQDGSLAFLPQDQRFFLRRASRAEVRSYLDWMHLKLGRSPAALDGALNPRGRRMRLAYFEGLWRGDINPHKNVPPRHHASGSGS